MAFEVTGIVSKIYDNGIKNTKNGERQMWAAMLMKEDGEEIKITIWADPGSQCPLLENAQVVTIPVSTGTYQSKTTYTYAPPAKEQPPQAEAKAPIITSEVASAVIDQLQEAIAKLSALVIE